MSDFNEKQAFAGIAAIAVPCSARKTKLPTQALQAGRIRRTDQASLASLWRQRLGDSTPSARVLAGELYAGASFRRAQVVAEGAGAPVFILSAGLGLVAAAKKVPAYDLTLSPSAKTAVQFNVTDAFDPGAWWEGLQAGPFACPMARLGEGKGRILIALTQPYAQLVAQALAAMPAGARGRIRLLGSGLESYLPEKLHPQIIQYDSRLDVLMPGTRLDSASRALAHFAGLVADQRLTTVGDDQLRVRLALDGVAYPATTTRPRLTDAALLKHIRPMVREGWSATMALKHLRAEIQVACEADRFRRLYEEVSA